MKKYLSLILSLVLVFSLTLTLTACSDDDETEDTDTTRVETSDTAIEPDSDNDAYTTTVNFDGETGVLHSNRLERIIAGYTTTFESIAYNITSLSDNPGDVTLRLYKSDDDAILAVCTLCPGETASFMSVGGYGQNYEITGEMEIVGKYTFTIDY